MAKRVSSLAIMLAVTIVLAIFVAVFAAGVSVTSYAIDPLEKGVSDTLSGSGTEEAPYVISSGDDLAYLAAQVNGGTTDYAGKHFELTQDIDLNGSEWTPIGKIEIGETQTTTKVFNGIFDGGGCTVSNVSISTKTVAAGLFGYVGTGGSVKNLTISGLNVTFGTTADDLGYAGAIAYNEGAVASVTVEDLDINVPDYFVGGVVGYNEGTEGTVSSCTLSSVTEATGKYIGGIVGINESDGTVENCLTTGDLKARQVGGIAAYNAGSITTCAFYGKAEGIVGAAGIAYTNNGTVENCLATGELKARQAGGIAAQNTGSITTCAFYGKAEGIVGAAGIAYTNNGTVKNCLTTGDLKARQVGGIAAYNAGSITTCAFYGKAEGVVGAAGIAYVNNGTVSNSLVAANVKATGETVENEFVEGAVYATAPNASNSNFVKYLTMEQGGIYADEMKDPKLDGWSAAKGRLPVPEVLAGNTSATEAALLSEAKVVTLDDVTDETFNLYNGWYLVLPAREKTGFSFDGWKEGESSYGPGAEVEISENTAFTAQWVLNEIVFVSQSEDISKVYDGTESTIAAEFTHDLTITYEWYYSSSDEGVFEKIDGANASSISLTNVSSSGKYYCVATVAAYGSSVTERSENFTVVISKADYTEEQVGTVPSFEGIYSKITTLESYVFENSSFRWKDSSVTPTVDKKTYEAFFNADPVNYNDYFLNIRLVLEKATYTKEDIGEVPSFSGTYSKTQSLSGAFVFKNSAFRWKDPSTVPTVKITSYAAYYNADPTNYKDYELNVTVTLSRGVFTQDMLPYIPSFSVTYDPERTLADIVLPENLYWNDGTEKPVASKSSYEAYFNSDSDNYENYCFPIEIAVAKAYPTLRPAVANVTYYEGNALPEIISASGDTAGTYDWDDYEGLVIGEKEYAWTFTPDDENYLTAKGTITITALRKYVTALTLVEMPEKTKYDAFDKIDATGMAVNVVYNDGSEESLSAYTVEYQTADSFRAGDEYIVLRYEEVSLRIEGFSVGKVDLTEPSDETEYVYEKGITHVYAVKSTDTYTVTGETFGSAAGLYRVTVTLTDPNNYCWQNESGASFTLEWEILKYEVSVPKANDGMTYDGTTKESGITAGAYYTATGTLSAINAGSYTVYVVLGDKVNTCWADGTTNDREVEWTIAKKKVPLPETLIVEKTYYYSGEMQTFEWKGGDGILISGEKQLDAGVYEVKFNLLKENFVWATGGDGEKTITWRILPKEITVPAVEEREFVYIPDTEQELVITKRQEYVVSGDSATDAGEYTAVISLVSGNYCWTGGGTADVTVEWEILPLEVTIPVMGTEMPVYCGETVYAPVNKADHYTLSGNSAVNAGSYRVVATLTSKNNYVWADGTTEDKNLDWTVEKKTLALPFYNGSVTYDGSVLEADITVDGSCVLSGNTAKNAGEYIAEISLKDANYVWADGTDGKKTVAWAIVPLKVSKPVVLGDSIYTPSGQYAAISESEYYTLSGNFALVTGNYTATATLKDKANLTWIDSTVEDLTLNWKIVPAKVFKPENLKNLIYSGSEQTADIRYSELCTISGNKAKDAGTYTATVSLKDTVNYTWEDGTVAPVTVEWSIYTLTLSDGEEVLQNYVAGTPLPSPQKENYFFDGWYASPDFSGERIYSLNEIDANTVLYAKWSEMPADGDGEPQSEPEGLPVGAIVGIALASAGALAAIVIIIIGLGKKGKIKRDI